MKVDHGYFSGSHWLNSIYKSAPSLNSQHKGDLGHLNKAQALCQVEMGPRTRNLVHRAKSLKEAHHGHRQSELVIEPTTQKGQSPKTHQLSFSFPWMISTLRREGKTQVQWETLITFFLRRDFIRYWIELVCQTYAVEA